ncbi:hypothetical protein A1OO_08815 [Enterovibrio norvegicus FF-33]|nr:hypothetical protein A1OO_08815 [Enterovibrio norvegicus FF-33]
MHNSFLGMPHSIHPEFAVVLEGKFWRDFGESILRKWAGISTNNPKVTIFDLYMQKNMREKSEFKLGTIYIIQLDKITNLPL